MTDRATTDKDGATVSPHVAAVDKCYRPGGKSGAHTFHWTSADENTVRCIVCGEVRENTKDSNKILKPGYYPQTFEPGATHDPV